MREQEIQSHIQKYIQSIGGYVFNTIKANRSGVSDLTACIQGRYISIEVKTPIGKLSALQQYHIGQVIQAGGLACTPTSLAQFKQFLAHHNLIPTVEEEV
jgi:hypothetical protein